MNEQDNFYQTFPGIPDYASGELFEIHTATMDYHGELIDHLQGDQLQWPASFPTQGDLDLDQISANGGGGWPTDQVTIGTVGPYAYTQPDARDETPGQDWPNEGVPAQPPQSRFNHQELHHNWDVELRATAYAPPQSRQSYGSDISRQLLGAGQNEASYESFFPSSSANSAIFYPEVNGTILPIPSNTLTVDNRSINTIDTVMNHFPYSNASSIMGDSRFDGNSHLEAFTRSAQSGFVQSSRGQSHGSFTSTNSKFVRHAAGEQSTSELIMVYYAI
jgi:hypothetical protein